MIVEIDKALDLKIEALFRYRGFEELYALTKEKNTTISGFHILLKNLQASIYHLDAYLEENWDLDENKINEKWKPIYDCLSKMGIPSIKHETYVAHIKKYEAHEKAIRKGILPSAYTFNYFYFYKSCDVKLMRRLILERFPVLKSLFNLSDWKLFDLVTEVNDDATDLFEDLTTINGNRILLTALTQGKEVSAFEFLQYLNDLEVRNKTWKYSSKPWTEKIKLLTQENIEQTKSVLSENLNNFTSQHRSAARILPHLNNLI